MPFLFYFFSCACQVLLHIRTEKGMGYPPAMAASDKYHGVAKFNVATGKQHKGVSGSTAVCWAVVVVGWLGRVQALQCSMG